MRRITAFTCISLFALSACDRSAPTDAIRIETRSDVLDGTTGGNPRFFFLPPVSAQPEFSGVFNANIAPTVEICRGTSQDALGHCTTLVDKFTRTDEHAGQIVEVSLTDQHYVLNFKASDYPIVSDVPFRVVVLVGDVQLGYVDLLKHGNAYVNATTREVITRNGTIPIKFRIETGALCGTSTECFEGLVDPAGGTFTITLADGTKPAGTEFPSGALNETVTLIIQRVTSGECLPTDVPQYQGCYRFTTEPHVDNFELPATVGVCLLDPAGLPFFNDQQLRLWKWSEVAGDPIQELERVQIEYLNCPSLTQIGMRPGSSMLLGAARAGAWLFKPFATLLGPRDAYAAAPYEGGKLSNFSLISWVRPLAVEIKSGDDQTAAAGTTLASSPRVRVVNKYGMTLMGVAGWTVNFTPSGDGQAIPPSALTDAAGEATTHWKLSTIPGANTLNALAPTSRVIAPTPYEAKAVFKATGTSPTHVNGRPQQ